MNEISSANSRKLVVRVADDRDREQIYRLRHEVYARELGQHPVRPEGVLSDPLDEFNVYLVAVDDGAIAGFISITPPGFGRYSVDKYVARTDFPFPIDETVFEVRLLTVLKPQRGKALAVLLMYAAYRWVETHGGTRIIGIGRREVLELYARVGMQPHAREIVAGAVRFQLMSAPVGSLAGLGETFAVLLNRLGRMVDWRLDFPFHEPAECFHGGASIGAVGMEFERMDRREAVINADVLDAWFPPSPQVVAALQENLSWLIGTSPPTDCGGLVRAIARARGVPAGSILPGAGSSDLIFLALRHWLGPESRVLLLDPTYGEYAHVLERVIHCRVERFGLERADGYQVNMERLEAVLTEAFDLVVLVNPNSPTGRHVPRAALEKLLRQVPERTRVWIDETYVDYAGAHESLEAWAAESENVVVCKSMSKAYALSGVRAAYLCAGQRLIKELREITPPWAISLPGQLAAVRALQDPAYYMQRYAETRRLREELADELAKLEGWEIIPGVANFLLCHLPEDGPDAATIVRRCAEEGLYLRDAAKMGRNLGRHAFRVAVKDGETNRWMVEILRRVLAHGPGGSA